MSGFTPELAVVLLNLAIIVLAYGLVYPRVAGSDFQRISICDLGASGLALLTVGMKYWGTGAAFNLLFTEVNWFWFTLVSYFVLELPAIFWYFKKYGVKLS
ncbi:MULTISPECIES: hypothetical protein [Shewanella]|uniref:hypothetical protein n=1 Tax=Shewanella TaxID=22 RepID=UPI001C657D50|nr:MULTISPECIES: hypothetical protein [Shewanella]QYJ75338.1 hypothetical protein K0H79_18720 [Shewanella sp. FJAT-52076]QYK05194.1 hypothetical protein K0H63_19470 [Shewanella zhangzhouensis]